MKTLVTIFLSFVFLGININQTFSLQTVNAELSYRVEFNYEVGNNFALGIALNPGIQVPSTVNNNAQFNYNVSLGVSQAGQLHCFYTIPI